jgi:hypothetical protein
MQVPVDAGLGEQGATAQVDPFAEQVRERNMGDARSIAAGLRGAQALLALSVKKMVEIHVGAPLMQAGARKSGVAADLSGEIPTSLSVAGELTSVKTDDEQGIS